MPAIPSAIARQILDEANRVLQTDETDDDKLLHLWHTLTFLRSRVISTLMRNTIGMKTYSGPFKGMELTEGILHKVFGPILSGSYESELHPAIERVIATPYRHILNIGCGWGFYVVGLARRMPPATSIHGYDIDPGEIALCRAMMALNKVEDRIDLHGEFPTQDFERFAAEGKTLAIVDIEGAEDALLDPDLYPALKKIDIIVELHDVNKAALSETVPQRFAATHDIEIVRNKIELFDFTPITGDKVYVDPFDRFAINWENRGGPTPWAAMWAKA